MKKTIFNFIAIISALVVTALPLSALAAEVTWYPEYDWDTGWTPNWAGSGHKDMVDEAVCNGLDDYNYTYTAGAHDSYGHYLSSIMGETITQIEITPCASTHSGSGESIMDVYYIFDSTQSAYAGNYTVTGTAPHILPTVTFSGLNHVVTSTSNFKFGVVLQNGAAGLVLSNIKAKLTY